MGYKVLFGSVPDWERDIENLPDDLEVVGTFDSYNDAFYHVADVLDERLNQLGFEFYHSHSDGDIWWTDDSGYSRMVGFFYESEAYIEDTGEWWVIVEE